MWGISRLTRDGTAERVSRDRNLTRELGQGNVIFPCSADHEQDWQPYPVDQYSAICDDHTYTPLIFLVAIAVCLLFFFSVQVVLISHSQGTIIAGDVLWKLWSDVDNDNLPQASL